MVVLAEIADWDWTAIGTLALAAATAWLGWENRAIVSSSRREVEMQREDLALAREQAKTSRETLEAQTQPLFSTVPYGFEYEPHRVDAATGKATSSRDAGTIDAGFTHSKGGTSRAWISVPFRNVGNAVGIVQEVLFILGNEPFAGGFPATPALPAGKRSRVRFTPREGGVGFEEARWTIGQRKPFKLVISYADAAGVIRGAVRMDIRYSERHIDPWHVRQEHLAESARQVLEEPRVRSAPMQ